MNFCIKNEGIGVFLLKTREFVNFPNKNEEMYEFHIKPNQIGEFSSKK